MSRRKSKAVLRGGGDGITAASAVPWAQTGSSQIPRGQKLNRKQRRAAESLLRRGLAEKEKAEPFGDPAQMIESVIPQSPEHHQWHMITH